MERRSRWKAASRKAVALALGATCAIAVLPMQPTAAAPGTTVTGGGTFAYTEQADPIGIGAGLSVSDGITYAGEYIEFEVTDATSHDLLSLATVATPVVDDGVVSIVGTSVYLGNGSVAEPIGSVDATRDGQAGRPLRVNFTAEFTNPGFETGDGLGWTAIQSRVELGVTSIAGFVTQDTATYPANAGGDHYVPSSATYTVRTTTTGEPTEGTYALELASTNMSVSACGVVHGPAAFSSEFQAAAGDKIYFDWRAFAGGDAYAVFGYIVDRDGVQTEVLDAYTTDTYGTTAWTTKETVIPDTGWYRFVFVAGTYDATCGTVAGARLLIDNVRVFGTKVSDDVAGQVARLVQYASTSDDPPASREITVTAKSNENGTGSDTVTVNITPVDDPTTLATPPVAELVNTMADDAFEPITGTLAPSDPDDDAFTFGATGAVAAPATIGGVIYSHAVEGTYATLHLDAATGAYAVVAKADAVDARLTADEETFTVSATASGAPATATLRVAVSIAASAPSAPSDPSATAGDGEASVSWTAPWWTGGAEITGYLIEVSEDDGETWTQHPTSSTDLTDTVGGLANGVSHQIRVRAVNSNGTSEPSPVVSVTPRTVPGAPSISDVDFGDGLLAVTVDAPAEDGGSVVTGYQVSVDDGATWSDTYPAPDAPAVLVVDGLTNGTTYPVRVRAVNDAGAGAASEAAPGTPLTTPAAPTITQLTAGNRQLTVRFAAPGDDGGTPVTGYQVSVDNGLTWSDTHDVESAITVFGLDNGTSYPVRVRAVNEVGAGAASDSLVATPQAAPVAPPAELDDDAPGAPVPEGEVKVIVNGEEEIVTVTVEDDGTWVLEGDGWSVSLSGLRADGTRLEADAEGRLIVEEGGQVRVTGTGFLPGSIVDVWIMSAPVLIGEVTVDGDGAFDELLDLPAGIRPGPHTVQLNGLSASGQNRSASIGIVVLAQPEPDVEEQPTPAAEPEVEADEQPRSGGSALPRTGGNAAETAGWATGLAVLGAALVLIGRRRQHS